MLKYKININELNKLSLNSVIIRKDLILKSNDKFKQKILPKINSLTITLPTTNIKSGFGFIITNASDVNFLNIITEDNTSDFILESGETKYFTFNGENWVETTEFIKYITLPFTLNHSLENDLGFNDNVKETIGNNEIKKIIPKITNIDKIKFKPKYDKIKIILWFAVFDSNGVYKYHTNKFSSTTPFDIETDFFSKSYFQINYYTDNLIFNNSLIDYKQNFFDSKWLEYSNDSIQKYTSMLIEKPYSGEYDLNINNYYFYYFEELFTPSNSNRITLYFNGEFKNTKTGKSQLFTTKTGGIVINNDNTINPDFFYGKMILEKNLSSCFYSYTDIDSEMQLNFYEVLNK